MATVVPENSTILREVESHVIEMVREKPAEVAQVRQVTQETQVTQVTQDTVIQGIQGIQGIQDKDTKGKGFKNTRPSFMQTHNENQIGLVTEALNSLTLSYQKKLSIKHRFISLLEEYTYRSNRYSKAFHTLRIIISVGSLIVPALLSVQFTGGSSSSGSSSTQVSASVYWVVWVLSLFVTISNALMTLMKIDKKYYTLHTTLHQIVSEGWLYIELSGKYSGYKTPGEAPTHENQYVYFCQSLEKIRMKQIGDEYYKLTEASQQSRSPEGDLLPLSPMRLPFAEEKSKLQINGPTVAIQEYEENRLGESVRVRA
jgi:hypothetical protein